MNQAKAADDTVGSLVAKMFESDELFDQLKAWKQNVPLVLYSLALSISL
jgi:hypothetical protein